MLSKQRKGGAGKQSTTDSGPKCLYERGVVVCCSEIMLLRTDDGCFSRDHLCGVGESSLCSDIIKVDARNS